MKYFQLLWRVQMIGLGALTLFGLLLSLLFMLEDLVISSTLNAEDNLALVVGLTLFYGAVPVILLGAPSYSLIVARGRYHWGPMVAIAMLPGVLLFFLHSGVGIIAIVAGLFVLSVTHAATKRWVDVSAAPAQAFRVPAALLSVLCAITAAIITAIVLISPIGGDGTTGIIGHSIFRLLILTALQAPIGIAGLVNSLLAFRMSMTWWPGLVANVLVFSITVFLYFN